MFEINEKSYKILPFFDRESATIRLGIYKKENGKEKLVNSVACEILPKKHSFLSSVKHFFMGLTKSWIKIPNTDILINTNSIANRLGISKKEVNEIAKSVDKLKECVNADVNKHKTEQIKNADQQIIAKCRKNPPVKGPKGLIDQLRYDFENELELHCTLRYDPKDHTFYLVKANQRPYAMDKDELKGTLLFNDVTIHYDQQKGEFYIDLGNRETISFGDKDQISFSERKGWLERQEQSDEDDTAHVYEKFGTEGEKILMVREDVLERIKTQSE